MLQRLRDAGLNGPLLTAAIGISVLMALGTWQLQRMAWKENLIAVINERTKAEPSDLLLAYSASRPPQEDAIGLEYLRVKVRGHFLHDKERYFYAPDPELGPGFNVYTPLEIAGGKIIVFVNRGYVPDRLKDPSSRAAGQVEGEVEVIGLIRQQSLQARFMPDNNAEQNVWYWRDVNGLAKSAFPDGKTTVLPLVVDQEANSLPGDGPKGGTTIVTLPNRHLEYAITWYGLAITFAVIFAVFAMGRLRQQKD